MDLISLDPWWVTWLESGTLEGTRELEFGLVRLRHALGGIGYRPLDLNRKETWPPSDRWILLLAHPAFIATRFVRQALMEAIRLNDYIHLLPSQNTQFGQPPANYATGYHLERYIERIAQMQGGRDVQDLPRVDLEHTSNHNRACSLGGIAGLFFRGDNFELVRRNLEANACNDPLSSILRNDSDILRSRLLIRGYCHDYGNYQAEDRSALLSMIPPEVESLVDIGGGQGLFASQVANSRNIRVALCEPSPVAASLARARGLFVYQQNFPDSIDTIAPWSPGDFQMVSMLDVLEHVGDPLNLLCAVHRVLKTSDRDVLESPKDNAAYLLLTVPNAGFWQCIEAIIAGRFAYESVGPWCITHRYFFTEKSLLELLQQAGFSVCIWSNEEQPIDQCFLEALQASGLPYDEENMKTASFHVLARINQ